MVEAGSAPPRRGLRAAIAAAFRLWRVDPGRTFLVLGGLAVLAGIPWALGSDALRNQPSPWVRFLASVGGSVWWAPVWALQLPFALRLARTGRASTQLLAGELRRTGRYAVLSVLLALPLALSGLVLAPIGGNTAWLATLCMLVLLGVVLVIMVRWVMAPVAMADTGIGPLGAVRASWALTRGRSRSVGGFVALYALAALVLLLAVRGHSIAGPLLFEAVAYPTLTLIYVCLYLEFAGPPERAADAP